MQNNPGTNLFAPLDEHVNIALTSEDFGNGHLAVFANCDNDPNTVALQLDTYANGCAILRTDLGSGNNVYYMTGTTDAPAWTLLTPGGGGGTIGGTIANREVAFGTGIDTIGGDPSFLWDNADKVLTIVDGVGNNMLSLIGNIGVYVLGGLNDVSLIVNGTDRQITASGFYINTPSSVSFTGSGLDDLSLVGSFTGSVTTSYNVIVVAVNNISLTYTGLTGGSFTDGDTITQTTGAGAGTTGFVYLDTGTGMYSLQTTDVGGGFGGGETIDNGAGVTATLTAGPFVILPDAFSWSSTDGGSGSLVPMDTAPIALSNGVTIDFGAIQGHTATDSWDWSYTVGTGRMLALNGLGKQAMGDIDVIGNGTVFTINDAAQTYNFTNLYDGAGLDQFVTINSSGTIGATSVSPASPAGTDTQVQINNMGAFGATANFTYRISDDYFQFGDPAKVGITGDSAAPLLHIYAGGAEIGHLGPAGQNYFNDGTMGGVISVDLANRNLPDNTGAISVDWLNRGLFDTSGTLKTFSWGDVNNLILGDVDSDAQGTKLIMDDSEGHLYMMHSGSVTGLDISYFNATADFGILQSGHGLYVDGPSTSVSLHSSGVTQLSVSNTAGLYLANIPAYADDAAAVVGGLTTGYVYKTTTLGSTYLKIVP